jgi:hypothetical protein
MVRKGKKANNKNRQREFPLHIFGAIAFIYSAQDPIRQYTCQGTNILRHDKVAVTQQHNRPVELNSVVHQVLVLQNCIKACAVRHLHHPNDIVCGLE